MFKQPLRSQWEWFNRLIKPIKTTIVVISRQRVNPWPAILVCNTVFTNNRNITDKIVFSRSRCLVSQYFNIGNVYFLNKDIFHSFEAGNCVSNSSFKWMKSRHNSTGQELRLEFDWAFESCASEGQNIALGRFLHKHGNIATEGSPKSGLCPTLINRIQGFLLCTVQRAV